MARANYVKCARKDNSAVSKGQPYWWWKFRYGPKHYSTTRPRASQLTQSAYKGTLLGIQEQGFDATSLEDLQTQRDDIRDQVQELLDQTQESLDNMPEQLQEAPTGELLTERIQSLEEYVDALDSVDIPEEEDVDPEDGQTVDEVLEECITNLQDIDCEVN